MGGSTQHRLRIVLKLASSADGAGVNVDAAKGNGAVTVCALYEANMRVKMSGRPQYEIDGAPVFLCSKDAYDQNEEQRLCIWLACQSVLFGCCYRSLMPAFFEGEA